MLHVLANIQYFALWDLPNITENHQILQYVLAKTHIFDFAGIRCNRTLHQKSCNYRKAKLLKNDNDFHQNWSTHASKSTSKNQIFIIILLHDCEDADFKSIKKRQGFTLYSPHWFAKSMPLKTTKKQQNICSIRATQNGKYQYFSRPSSNSPPSKGHPWEALGGPKTPCFPPSLYLSPWRMRCLKNHLQKVWKSSFRTKWLTPTFDSLYLIYNLYITYT